MANQQQKDSNEEQGLVSQLPSPPLLDTLFSRRESQDKSPSSFPPTKTVPFNDSQQLRSYFSELLVTRHTPSRQQTSRRQGLTGFGESLTSDEAVERVRVAEEEKKKKEDEKKARKRIREERKRQREEQQTSRARKRRKQVNTHKKPIRKTSVNRGKGGKLPTSSRSLNHQQQNSTVKFTDEPCAHCGLYWSGEEDWVECRSCLLCYHTSCVATEEYIEQDDFLCPDCEY